MVSLTFIVWINNFKMQEKQLRRIDNPWAYCQLADLPQLPSCICKLYKSAPTGPMFLSSLLSYETCRFGVGRLGNSAASQNVSSCLWNFHEFDKHMRTMVACRESVNLYQFVLSCLTKSGAHPSKVRLSHGWAVPAAKQYTNRKKEAQVQVFKCWTPRQSKDAVQKWSQIRILSLLHSCPKHPNRSPSFRLQLVSINQTTDYKQQKKSPWPRHGVLLRRSKQSVAAMILYTHFSAGSILFCTWASYARWPSLDLQIANHRGAGQVPYGRHEPTAAEAAAVVCWDCKRDQHSPGKRLVALLKIPTGSPTWIRSSSSFPEQQAVPILWQGRSHDAPDHQPCCRLIAMQASRKHRDSGHVFSIKWANIFKREARPVKVQGHVKR